MRQLTQTTLILAGLTIAVATGYFGARWSSPAAATTEPAEEAAAPVPVQIALVRQGRVEEMGMAYGVVESRPASAVAVTVPFESVTEKVHVSVGDSVAAGATLVDIAASPDSQLQLRHAEEAAAAAEKALAQAKQRRDENLATNADIAAAEAVQQAAQTDLQFRKSRQSAGTTLTTTVAGVVTAVSTQPGQLNAAGAVVVVVSPAGAAEVRVGVEPADAAKLKAGDSVRLRPVGGEDDPVDGTVRQVGSMLNPQTHLADVFVTPPADAKLPAGAFVKADYVRRTAEGLIVPRLATTFDDGEWAVFVVHDGKVTKHTVTLGVAGDDAVQVTGDGVAAGDNVVTTRNGDLDDGAAVQVGDTDAPSTQPADKAGGGQ